jgi:hypothetical protein
MRSAGNFHPEWGYLAPAPKFMRSARIAVVATAIGATAGAMVVLSLVGRPNADDPSIASHALVISAPIVTAPATAESVADKPPVSIAAAPTPRVRTPAPAPNASAAGAVASADENPTTSSSPALTPSSAIGGTAAASADAVSAIDSHSTSAASDNVPPRKIATRRRRPTRYEASRRWQSEQEARQRWREDKGFGPLLRLFSFRTGGPYSSN